MDGDGGSFEDPGGVLPLSGQTDCGDDGKMWEYPLVVAALEAEGLYPKQEYIWRRKATIAEQVSFRPIDELCTKAKRMPGKSQMMRWWYHDMVQ